MSETSPTGREQSWLRKSAQSTARAVKQWVQRADKTASERPGKAGDLYNASKAKTSDTTSKSKEKVGQFVSQMDSSMSEAVRNRLLAEYREAVDEALDTALQVITAQAAHIEILEKQIADLEAEHE